MEDILAVEAELLRSEGIDPGLPDADVAREAEPTTAPYYEAFGR